MHPSAVVPVTMNVLFAFFVRPRNWMDPLAADEVISALWPVFAVAVNFVQGDVYVGAVKMTVRVTPPTAAVAVHDPVAGSQLSPPASPLMTGPPASAASDPPQPARSITAHAMTAPAAFPLPERELNAPKRLSRALIVGRASPGLSPIIVHVSVTIGDGGGEHYRVNTVIFRKFCPGLRGLSYFRSLERALRVDQRLGRHPAARRQVMTYGFISSSTIRTSPTARSAGATGP